MNVTIAVALITTFSALAGGFIASVTTLRAQGKQLKQQNLLAAEERSSKDSDRRREIRRAAYLEFLNKLDEAERAVAGCWKRDGLTQDHFTATWSVVRSLNTPANVISMEGPLVMDAVAQMTRYVYHQELIRIHEIFEKSQHANGAIITDRDEEYGDSFGRREHAKSEFTKIARTVLGNEAWGEELEEERTRVTSRRWSQLPEPGNSKLARQGELDTVRSISEHRV